MDEIEQLLAILPASTDPDVLSVQREEVQSYIKWARSITEDYKHLRRKITLPFLGFFVLALVLAIGLGIVNYKISNPTISVILTILEIIMVVVSLFSLSGFFDIFGYIGGPCQICLKNARSLPLSFLPICPRCLYREIEILLTRACSEEYQTAKERLIDWVKRGLHLEIADIVAKRVDEMRGGINIRRMGKFWYPSSSYHELSLDDQPIGMPKIALERLSSLKQSPVASYIGGIKLFDYLIIGFWRSKLQYLLLAKVTMFDYSEWYRIYIWESPWKYGG